MRITVRAIAKLCDQNMGSLKYFNINLLPLVTLYPPSLSGSNVHTQEQLLGCCCEWRNASPQCERLLSSRDTSWPLYSCRNTFSAFSFYTLVVKVQQCSVVPNSGSSDTLTNSNWTELNFVWYTMPPKFDPNEVKVGMFVEYGNPLTDFWLCVSGHACALASRAGINKLFTEPYKLVKAFKLNIWMYNV